MIYLGCFAPRGWDIVGVEATLPMAVMMASHVLLPVSFIVSAYYLKTETRLTYSQSLRLILLLWSLTTKEIALSLGQAV